MQLLIILALLLYGSKGGGRELLKEVRPVLESMGGDEVKEAFKNAEQISEVLSAVQELAGADLTEIFRPEQPARRIQPPYDSDGEGQGGFTPEFSGSSVNFPLAPISSIADKDITYSLSRYISQNA